MTGQGSTSVDRRLGSLLIVVAFKAGKRPSSCGVTGISCHLKNPETFLYKQKPENNSPFSL